MVADAPRIGEMLPSFLEFLGGGVVVGHNVRFDLSFLNHALESTGRDRLANATVDTLALARRLVRDQVPNCKLGTLAAILRLPHQPSHRALTDVLATGDLLHTLLERAGTTPEMLDAVLALRPHSPLDAEQRLEALKAFLQLPEAPVLTAINKRIVNILRKAPPSADAAVQPAALTHDAEAALYRAVTDLSGAVAQACWSAATRRR